MTDIDWSKAPEDATHAFVYAGNFLGWRKLINGEWQMRDARDSWSATVEPMEQFYVQRPSAPTWTGEDLPPVGTVCEFAAYQGGDPVWKECKVIAHDDGFAVISYKGNYSGQSNSHLRPIRTAEQIAAEEQKILQLNACEEIEPKIEGYNVDIDCSAAIRMTINAMIEAGYRKVQP